jgi:hypothetical protein
MLYMPLFLTADGRKEVADAKKGIAQIEQKQDPNRLLKGREQERLSFLRAIIRRDLFEKCSAAGLGVALTVGSLMYKNRPAQDKPDASATAVSPVHEQEHPLSEAELDQLIMRVEEDFLAWEPIVRSAVEQRGGLPQGVVAHHFYAPFEVVRDNRSNTLRNGRLLSRLHKENERVALENINYFAYDTLGQGPAAPMQAAIAASFSPVRRSLHLALDIDPSQPLDMLVTYHEVMHAVQDANTRAAIQSEEQLQKYLAGHRIAPDGRMRTNILMEIDAYASELELADILMKGRLRDGTATVDDMLHTLHPTPEQAGLVVMLHSMASFYFPHGIRDGVYPPSFVNVITGIYKEGGYDVYLEQ